MTKCEEECEEINYDDDTNLNNANDIKCKGIKMNLCLNVTEVMPCDWSVDYLYVNTFAICHN